MTFASEAVERGAALLDEKMPGWASKIDLEELQLESGRRCVLGQLSSTIPLTLWERYGHSSLEEGIACHRGETVESLSETVCSADWDIARNKLGLTLQEATWSGFVAARGYTVPNGEHSTYQEQWEKFLAEVGAFVGDCDSSYPQLNVEWTRAILNRQDRSN